MPPLLQLQKLLGKGDGGWKKSVFASFFGGPEDHKFVEKNMFWDILQHEQQVIACCQTRFDYGPSKMPLKLAL